MNTWLQRGDHNGKFSQQRIQRLLIGLSAINTWLQPGDTAGTLSQQPFHRLLVALSLTEAVKRLGDRRRCRHPSETGVNGEVRMLLRYYSERGRGD
jgi:hypothetical protein